jgi:lauroyl/myristoyl acyltransferase
MRAANLFPLIMEKLLYITACLLIKLLQALPLTAVALIGRHSGGLAYWLDARHRRTALRNLHLCFGDEMTPGQIRALARENFRRLGENYCSAIKTAAMSFDELRSRLEFVGADKIILPASGQSSPSRIIAIGHFGNFELYARFGQFVPGFQCATTYRALRQPSLNRLLQSLRASTGCLFFERRTDAAALKATLARRPLLLGLLSDQNAGSGGLRVPFLGYECSTTSAPALLALRYRCALHTGVCFRTGLGRWRIEAGDEIPTHEFGRPRSLEAITSDINRAFEMAVHRDPANWFWVHNRWKPVRSKRPTARPDFDTPQPCDLARQG